MTGGFMEKVVRKLKLLSTFLIPIAMVSCHYKWTAPFFWSHQSSKAADMAFAGFVIPTILFGWLVVYVANEWNRKP